MYHLRVGVPKQVYQLSGKSVLLKLLDHLTDENVFLSSHNPTANNNTSSYCPASSKMILFTF